MYEKIARNYINNMNVEDIKQFASKNNISLSTDEAIILYNFLKNNYQELLKGNDLVLEKVKNKVSLNTYNTAHLMYYDAKKKFLH